MQFILFTYNPFYSCKLFVVQSLSPLFVTSWTAHEHTRLPCPSPCPLITSIKSVIPSNHLILCHPLLLLPSIFPSIRLFSNEFTVCIRWPKYGSFSISPSSECSGLISFKIDWFDLLAVQRSLRSLLQHHSYKVSIFPHSAFMVHLSHLYMTTGKTIALTIAADLWQQSDVSAF